MTKHKKFYYQYKALKYKIKYENLKVEIYGGKKKTKAKKAFKMLKSLKKKLKCKSCVAPSHCLQTQIKKFQKKIGNKKSRNNDKGRNNYDILHEEFVAFGEKLKESSDKLSMDPALFAKYLKHTTKLILKAKRCYKIVTTKHKRLKALKKLLEKESLSDKNKEKYEGEQEALRSWFKGISGEPVNEE